MTAANALTFSRLGVTAAFVACLVAASGDGSISGREAALIILIALCSEATDIFDGVLARRMGTAGPVGGILDPLCDSLSRIAMYFALALTGFVTIAVPLVMTGRDIVVAYVRIFSAITGGKTSARLSGKLKAIVQGSGAPLLVLMAWASPRFSLGEYGLWATWTAVAVIAVTLWSMCDYIAGAASAYKARAR